jgi:DNA-binding transcriptional ArsR family regulator
MTRIYYSPPSRNWTALENDFVDGPTPDDYPRESWTLVRMIRHHKAVFSQRQHLCNAINKPLKTFERHLRTLRELGFVEPMDDGYRIKIGEHVLELAAETVEVEPEKLIMAEIEEQPKRKPTGLSQKDRWELIKEAWNKHKPEGYLQLDGSLNKPLLIAIDTQSKRLGIDRDDYDAFIGAVLRGAGADDWWSSKDMNATKVFGFGANLDDKKFFNVEKLYKSGLTIERKEQRGAANVEAIRRRQEEEFRKMDEVEAAQAEGAKRTTEEFNEIADAWDKTRKEGWASCRADRVVLSMIQMARTKLGVTENYEDFLGKCFEGYIGQQLTPRDFVDPRNMISPKWRETPLVDSYTWYQKENA